MAPVANALTPPPNRPERPLVIAVASGLNAAVTTRFDSRSASDLSTSSSCLPPAAASRKARDSALASPPALTIRLLVRDCTPSSASIRSCALLSSELSAIGKPLHQFVERGTRQRRAAAAGHRLDRQRQLARRHRPECGGRQPQHAEPEADRLAPGERHNRRAHRAAGAFGKGRGGASSTPNVAEIRSAAMRT